MEEKLTHDFFARPTLRVAQDLLGKKLTFKGLEGLITETEAYIGQDDPACHASKGLTPRTRVMFGPAGFSYVYLIYGMYHCLNVVTEATGFPAAVLIRGLKLITPPLTDLNGPGKVCRALGVTTFHNNINMVESDAFFLSHTSLKPKFHSTPRVGIKVGTDRMWRFVINDLTSL